MKNVYLLLAILGALVPVAFFLGLFHTEMVGVGGFIPALFVNSAAGGFTADLLITSVVFWVFMFNAQTGPKPWIFIALNLCIGLSCALPAYLYRREVMQKQLA
jgi:uncharacterized protein DUF2834